MNGPTTRPAPPLPPTMVRVTMVYTRNEDGHFVCPTCGLVKANQSSMYYHMKKHQETRNHTCTHCNKGFLQKQTLDLHMRSKHARHPTTPLLTAAVASASGSASASSSTTESDNEDEKTYQCPFDNCEFKALTKGNRIIHCLRIHFQKELRPTLTIYTDTKEHHCTTCNRDFSSATGFYYHCKDCFTSTGKKYQTLRSIF